MPRRSPSKKRRPHSNSGSAPSKWQKQSKPGRDISRLLDPSPRVERAGDGDWFVQYIPPMNAQKTYTCPECMTSIRPGVAHLVVWQEDHMFGSQRAIEERRHWHQHCWQTRRFW
ncbi:ATP/GTP-binding protein [Rothia sp. P5764]|uniref:ATP/GTP-binding protein n=1 Tax=Rothia sp. P5764 TaxID=3402654 RepID=UPI003AC6A26C